ADLNEVLRLNPEFAAGFYHRGLAHHGAGEYAKAITDYAAAIRLAPQIPDAYNDLAWLLATCPDPKIRNGKTALRSAQKACELAESPSWRFFDTLAASYAAAGEFAQAV